MEVLKSSIESLDKATNKEEQIKALQQVNKLLLTEYCLEIADNFKIYPVEIEAYYYNKGLFEDECVHRNELQKGRERFGKLYFHRKGNTAENKIISHRGGVDICLPLSDDNYLAFLVRSARINDEIEAINGPAKLAQRIIQFLNDNNPTIKEKEVVVKRRDAIFEPKYLINSNRIGLGSGYVYAQAPLRSLTDMKISKQKEKDLRDYLTENFIWATDEIKKCKSKEILGYVIKTI